MSGFAALAFLTVITFVVLGGAKSLGRRVLETIAVDGIAYFPVKYLVAVASNPAEIPAKKVETGSSQATEAELFLGMEPGTIAVLIVVMLFVGLFGFLGSKLIDRGQ